MNKKLGTTTETGFQFFGRMSASISHEIKNVLAIINENAGLLEDFALLAERGASIDPGRLKKLAATVMNQVGRGDGIIKKMNRLAHSIDESIATVELSEFIELFISLTDRLTAMQGVTVESQLPENKIKITTLPFFLLNLLWLCLEFALATTGGMKKIELSAEQAKDSYRIRFKRLAGLSDEIAQNFPSEPVNSLLDLLEAGITVNPEIEEILLKLPENIDKNN